MKFLFLVFLVATIASCTMISGSGRITSEKRDVEPFSEVESAGSLKVELSTGNAPSVEVEADDNIIPHIRTSVKNGRLSISLEEGGYSNIHAVIYVKAPLYSKLITSGSGSIYAKGVLVNSESMELVVTGSGSIKAEVNSPFVKAVLDGSGSLEVSGKTKIFDAKNSGSGSLKCSSLLSEATTIKNAGSGSSHVFASVKLEAAVDGSGSVIYHGSPQTTKIDDDGSGSISKAN